jgi:hypothetical protein
MMKNTWIGDSLRHNKLCQDQWQMSRHDDPAIGAAGQGHEISILEDLGLGLRLHCRLGN